MAEGVDVRGVILYNVTGITLEVEDGLPISLEKSALLVAGRNDVSLAQLLNVNANGAVRTQPVAAFADTAQGFADLGGVGATIVLPAVAGRRLYLTEISATSTLTLAAAVTLETTGGVAVHRWQLPVGIGPIQGSLRTSLRSGVGEGWQVSLSAFLAGVLSVNMAGFYADI